MRKTDIIENNDNLIEKITRSENRKLLYASIFFVITIIAIITVSTRLLNNPQDIRQRAENTPPSNDEISTPSATITGSL